MQGRASGLAECPRGAHGRRHLRVGRRGFEAVHAPAGRCQRRGPRGVAPQGRAPAGRLGAHTVGDMTGIARLGNGAGRPDAAACTIVARGGGRPPACRRAAGPACPLGRRHRAGGATPLHRGLGPPAVGWTPQLACAGTPVTRRGGGQAVSADPPQRRAPAGRSARAGGLIGPGGWQPCHTPAGAAACRRARRGRGPTPPTLRCPPPRAERRRPEQPVQEDAWGRLRRRGAAPVSPPAAVRTFPSRWRDRRSPPFPGVPPQVSGSAGRRHRRVGRRTPNHARHTPRVPRPRVFFFFVCLAADGAPGVAGALPQPLARLAVAAAAAAAAASRGGRPLRRPPRRASGRCPWGPCPSRRGWSSRHRWGCPRHRRHTRRRARRGRQRRRRRRRSSSLSPTRTPSPSPSPTPTPSPALPPRLGYHAHTRTERTFVKSPCL